TERVAVIASGVSLHNGALSAASERLANELLRVEHAQEHDGHFRSGLPKDSDRLKPIESGHVDVQDDDIGNDFIHRVERLDAVACGAHDVEAISQQRGHLVQDSTVVVDEKHSRLGAAGADHTGQSTH